MAVRPIAGVLAAAVTPALTLAPAADARVIDVWDCHTFHVRGHRWLTGTWLYPCLVEDHMMRGMIGIYPVAAQ